MIFRVRPVRFHFLARDPLHFEVGKAANSLRGALGTVLAHDIFRASGSSAGPSGFADPPRPFVFRAAHLEETTIAADEEFYFDMNLFDTRQALVEALAVAYSQLKTLYGRKVELAAVAPLDVVDIELSRGREAGCISEIIVRFVTPIELKGGDMLVSQPDFGALARRVRDRVSTLSQLYGSGALDINFSAFGQRADEVRTIRCDVIHHELARRSTRTGQVHPIGGFTGEACYSGKLAEFLPYLQAAQWTGVGRHTVWGNGAIELVQPPF
ncbi:MAG TPA: CRISPR system precrRNA processing endoribonuclease RAMP protein Cas6 [Bryobacteraceae bacterium]|nr:CRISPR system precrRNA processing endoribonuclease RAMP protein Cas6 [Bryobacteraceae bacterium]